MRVRLVVLDIDGTLLNSKGEMTERVERAVRRTLASGIGVTLATGRLLRSALPIARRLGIDLPLIVHNGATIIDPAGGRPLYARRLRPSTAAAILRALRAVTASSFLYRFEPVASPPGGDALPGGEGPVPFQETIFYDSELSLRRLRTVYDVAERHLRYVPDLVEVVEPPPLRVVAYGEREALEAVAARFQGAGGPAGGSGRADAAKVIPWDRGLDPIAVCEFFHPDCSKGTAVAVLARHLGVPRQAIAAVGDQMNDLEMLTFAGYGVAMGNAPAAVRMAARYSTSSNDEDGVARVLDEISRL